MSGIANWQAQIRIDIEDLKKRIKVAEGEINNFTNEDRKVKLDIDTQTLESAIQKLDKMLDSLGKGTGDFKQFENLSKELLSIVSEVKNLSKAFGKVDDSGAKTLLSSIQNIDKSLSELSQNILNVNKNMSNMGGNTSGAVKQVENISNAYQDAAKEAEKLVDAQSKIGHKTNISSESKVDEVVSSAKDLDNTLNQIDIPTDSFDKVLEKLDRTKSELVDIVKITKQPVSDADGKFHDSYTLKDSRGSTEIYGMNSKTDKGQILRQNIVVYDAKKDTELIQKNKTAYEELTEAIRQYSEVSKRVSSGKAKDDDIEKMSQLEEKISQLQKQPILSDSQVAKSESALVSLYDQLDKIERKLQETNQKQVGSGFGKLFTYQSKIDKYNTTINRFNDGGWTSSAYLDNVQAVKNAVKEYETLLNELKGKDASLVTSEDINRLDNYEKKIKDTIATVTNVSASEKGYNFVSGQKELDKIHKLLAENSKMSAEAKAKIKAYYKEIESGNPSMSLDRIHGEIMKIYNAEVEAGRAGRSFFDTLKNSGFHQIAAQMAGMVGIYDVINVVKEGINTVRELDTAMTEVRKVSDATEAQYASFRDTVSSTAKEIASTNKELLNSSADFLRLGYSLEQAENLAKNATLFVNVGDGVDITEATEDMITAMKAFDIQAEDSIKIVDDYNQIGNKYALSATDIGEAMKRSASALEVGNNSFEESIGLITAMNEIVQNSENTGNSLKVLSLRLRGAKAELEDMGEDTDGLCDSTSKLREQVKALSGVDIMEDDNTFKSTAQQVKELGEAFVKLDDVSQAALLEIIAGKSRSNAVAALLKNYQQIDNVIADLGDAEGSALRENEAIVDSIDGRIKVLSATAEEFWQKFIDTDFVKNAVSLASDLLGLLTQIIDKFGTLPTILTGIGAALSFKNVGEWNYISKFHSNNIICFIV